MLVADTTVPWVANMYAASQGTVTQEQIIGMFDALEAAIYFNFKDLDATLDVIYVTLLAPEFIVGIPRALFPLRYELLNWKPFLTRAWMELSSRSNLDVQELLQGLL